METDISVIVLGQGSLFRAGLVSLLISLGFERVLEAATVAELEQLQTNAQDVQLLLAHFSDEIDDIVQWMQQVRKWLPQAKIVILSPKLQLKSMIECFAAGISGYLLEDLSRDALRQSLTLVRTGEKIFPSELASIIGDVISNQSSERGVGDLQDGLSDREVEILRLLSSGHANKLIAADLGIAESTVKVHLKHILRKTRASNRTQAALWAVRHGIVREADELPRSRPVRKPPEDMPAEDMPAEDEVSETTDQ